VRDGTWAELDEAQVPYETPSTTSWSTSTIMPASSASRDICTRFGFGRPVTVPSWPTRIPDLMRIRSPGLGPLLKRSVSWGDVDCTRSSSGFNTSRHPSSDSKQNPDQENAAGLEKYSPKSRIACFLPPFTIASWSISRSRAAGVVHFLLRLQHHRQKTKPQNLV